MGSREASVTLLSRARTARVGHKAGCTEKRGNSGKNRALWRAVLSKTAPVGFLSGPLCVRKGLSLIGIWLLLGAQGKNHLRALTIQRNPVPFLLWLAPPS